MSDVAAQAEVPIESRLEAYFGGTPVEPATKAPAATEADDTVVGAPETDDVPEGIDPTAEAVAEQPEGEEPFEELTHLDKTYEVPVSLKKAFEENRAMATRAAQTAKQAEALLQHVNAQAQLVQAETGFNKWAESELSEKARLEGVLAQYKKLDWYAMSPEQYAENRRNRDILAEQLADAEKALGGKREQYQGWRSQQYNEMLSKGVEYLRKAVPNFESESTRNVIAAEAKALGFTQAEVESLADPRVVVALHKAAQWDRLQASKPATQNKVAKAAPIVRAAGSDSQRTEAQSKHIAARARLKKTGSVDDFAAALLTRMR